MSKGENKDKKEDLHKQFKPNVHLKEYFRWEHLVELLTRQYIRL